MQAIIGPGAFPRALRPLTDTRAMAMLPVAGRPLIDFQLAWLSRFEVDGVTVVPHMPDQRLADYARQAERRFGLAVRVWVGGNGRADGGWGAHDGIILVTGGLLTDWDLGPEIRAWRSGRVFGDPHPVRTGLWLASPAVLTALRASPELEGTWPGETGGPFAGERSGSGYWTEITDGVRYRQAQIDVMAGLVTGLPPDWTEPVAAEATVQDNVRITGPVRILRGATVEAGARIGPYSVIGEGTRVGAWSRVARSTLGDGCRLGPGVQLDGAVVGSRVIVDGDVRMEDVVVGDEAHVGWGAILHHGLAIPSRGRVPPGEECFVHHDWSRQPGYFHRHH